MEIACPDGCVYLDGAHAAGWERRTTELDRDSRRVLPHVQALNESQRELFLAVLVGIREMGRQHGDLDDRRLSDALGALRKTVETRVRGVIYEHRAEDARAQALVADLADWLKGRPASDRAPAAPDADQLAVIKALEATLASVIAERSDPRAFLDMVARVTAGAEPTAQSEPSPLLLT